MGVIYGLFDPRKPLWLWEVRYIGQTTQDLNRCLRRHVYDTLGDPDGDVQAWIFDLLCSGHVPEMRTLERSPKSRLNERERTWVDSGRRQGWDLLNAIHDRPAHYGQHGPTPKNAVRAYWDHVIKGESEDDCWDWNIGNGSYGVFYVTADGVNTRYSAHRFSWVLHNGPIPEQEDELCVLHRCDNPPCSNPSHLWLGTRAENMVDKEAKGRGKYPRRDQTHCKRGHPLSGNNLYVDPKTGRRHCRECRRAHDREMYRKKMESQGLAVAPRNSDRTHCPKGHPYDEENTYISRSGSRVCRTCVSDRHKRNQ